MSNQPDRRAPSHEKDRASTAWDRCKKHLQSILDQQEFERWIAPLSASLNGASICVKAPDDFFADRLEAHGYYWDLIQSTLQTLHPQKLRIRLEAVERKSVSSADILPQKPSASERIKHSGLRRQFSFSNFITGDSNNVVCAAARQIAGNVEQSLYSPFFIYGRSGLGKTHLLYAIGNHLVRHTDARVHYQHAPRFVANFVAALKDNRGLDFKQYYNQFDVLLIDDVHLLAGKVRSQEELFQITNRMLERHKQLVFTCDCFPRDLEGFSTPLRSRFGGGLALEVKPPELELRVAFLQKSSSSFGFELPEDVAYLIGKKIRSSMRDLLSALATLKAYSEFSHKPLSVISANQALEGAFAAHSRSLTVDQIIHTVASYYRFSAADLTSKIRRQPIVRARHLSMALAKELTSLSLGEIGVVFNRSHTSVLHACRKIRRLKEDNPAIDSDYRKLLASLSH